MVTGTAHTPGSHRNYFVIVVAAGSGTRFGASMPKQFLALAGKPVVVHALEAFRHALPEAEICLVLSETGREIWAGMSKDYDLRNITVVSGGDSRTASVRNALAAISSKLDWQSVVLIHDGARPLVGEALIKRVAEEFAKPGVEAVVPVRPLTEALATAPCNGKVAPADRALFVSVQTPQAFKAKLLTEAYDALGDKVLADDAAVYHAFTGKELDTVEGNSSNIKITHPADIELAEVLMRHCYNKA